MAGSKQHPTDNVLGHGSRLRKDKPTTVRKVLTRLAAITVAIITLTVVGLPQPASATTGTITRYPSPGCLPYPKYSFYSTPGSVGATDGAASYFGNGVWSYDQWTGFQLVVKYYSGGRLYEIRGSTLWSHNGWPSTDGARWVETPDGQWYNLSLDEHRSYYAEGFSQVVLPSRGTYYVYGIYIWRPVYLTTGAMLDPGGSYTASFGPLYCG